MLRTSGSFMRSTMTRFLEAGSATTSFSSWLHHVTHCVCTAARGVPSVPSQAPPMQVPSEERFMYIMQSGSVWYGSAKHAARAGQVAWQCAEIAARAWQKRANIQLAWLGLVTAVSSYERWLSIST